MKKILGLLSCLLLFGSCNDGTVTSTGFNFDPTIPVVSCSALNNGLYYKISGVEALILQTDPKYFVNQVTQAGKPITVLIDNSTTSVLYRTFNAAVPDTYFCSVIPPATPVVTDQWIAASGTADVSGNGVSGYLVITTTAIKDPTTLSITGYNHSIVFKNITFSNGKNTFVYDSFVFGNYITTVTP